MKRLAAIVGISLTAVLGIGAFVLTSNDATTAAKRPSKTVKSSSVKDAANKITTTSVKSEPPVPPTTEKKGDDSAEGYEAKKAFVGVSPQVKAGEKVEIEIRGFAKNTSLTVTVDKATTSVTTNKEGKAQLKVTAPTVANTYTVSVTGLTSTGTTTTLTKSFKVVVKK